MLTAQVGTHFQLAATPHTRPLVSVVKVPSLLMNFAILRVGWQVFCFTLVVILRHSPYIGTNRRALVKATSHNKIPPAFVMAQPAASENLLTHWKVLTFPCPR